MNASKSVPSRAFHHSTGKTMHKLNYQPSRWAAKPLGSPMLEPCGFPYSCFQLIASAATAAVGGATAVAVVFSWLSL